MGKIGKEELNTGTGHRGSIGIESGKQDKSQQILKAATIAVNVLCLIPVLVIALYNVPSADDFSMTNEVHDAFTGGGVFAAIAKAVYMGYWYFMNWTGVYFSNTLTALGPQIFSEKLYFLGTFAVLLMFTAGLYFFMKKLLRDVLAISRNICVCITGIVYFIIIQCMPAGLPRVESFFWYSGAINYMFMLGLGLLWTGLMIGTAHKSAFKDNAVSGNKSDKLKSVSTSGAVSPLRIVMLSLLGFLLGGANYLTALSLGILSVIILVTAVIFRISDGGNRESMKRCDSDQRKLVDIASVPDAARELGGALRYVVVPAVFMLLGIILSASAPGNHVRSAESAFSPVKAVMIAIYYTFEYMLGEFLTWPVIVLLIILLPLMWIAAGEAVKKYEFGHPILFALFAFLLTAASITPPVYATGSIEAGRIQGIFYAQGMLLFILILGYICGYVRKISGFDREPDLIRICAFAACVFLVGAGLSVKADPYFFTGSAAAADLASGSAQKYRSEFDERLGLLKSSDAEDVELKEFTEKPALLFFSDITFDKNDWLNKSLAEYYHKKCVTLTK